MSLKNVEIRLAIESKRLRYYEVAEALGISAAWFSKLLREELPREKKKQILDVISSYEF